MTRILGLNVVPEMLGLWVLETSMCFLVFYTLLHGSPLIWLQGGLLDGLADGAALNALLLALTVGLVGYATGLYRPETCLAVRRLLRQAVMSAAISLPAVWLVAKAARIDLATLFGGRPGWPLEMLFAWTVLLLATRILYTTAQSMDIFVRHVAVLGDSAATIRTVDAIAGKRRGLFRVEVIQPLAGAAAAGFGGISLPYGLWAVVSTDPQAMPEVPAGVRRFDAQTFWENQLGRIDVGKDAASGDADARPGLSSGPGELARRLLDVVVATALLLLTTPVLLVTALLIRVESAGPVIYRQERVGLNGRSFTIWKFRSMRQDAEKLGPTWASLRDARVTAVGAFIRKVRIDELPQLVNILRGEMSMVGPRPERPHFVEQLAAVIPSYRERARVKPGLTGWAQVNYPYGASVEDARAKLSYDLYYVKHRSLLFDLAIILATVRVILFQEGAR